MPKVSIRAIKLNAGGYTSRGQYFGVGPTVYEITVDGEGVGHVRAKGNFETRERVLARVKEDVAKGAYGSQYGGPGYHGNPKSYR